MASPAIYSTTKLYYATSSAETEIPGITNISGVNFAKAEIDITNMSSTAKEYKAAALSDPGTLTFDLQFAPANVIHNDIVQKSATQATTTDIFKLRFSDGTNWRFTGSFLTFNITAADPAAGVLTAQGSIRLTGAVVFASGSVA